MLSLLARLLLVFRFITAKFSVCTNVGFMAGALCGFMLVLEHNVDRAYHLASLHDVLIVALLLALTAWLFILLVLCVIARFAFASIALPSLISCFLTAFMTTYLCNRYSIFAWGLLVGMLVGIVIGAALCVINGFFRRSTVT